MNGSMGDGGRCWDFGVGMDFECGEEGEVARVCEWVSVSGVDEEEEEDAEKEV